MPDAVPDAVPGLDPPSLLAGAVCGVPLVLLVLLVLAVILLPWLRRGNEW